MEIFYLPVGNPSVFEEFCGVSHSVGGHLSIWKTPIMY